MDLDAKALTLHVLFPLARRFFSSFSILPDFAVWSTLQSLTLTWNPTACQQIPLLLFLRFVLICECQTYACFGALHFALAFFGLWYSSSEFHMFDSFSSHIAHSNVCTSERPSPTMLDEADPFLNTFHDIILLKLFSTTFVTVWIMLLINTFNDH